jgi:hypothetical protein
VLALLRGLFERKTLGVDNAWALLFAGYGTSSSISVSYENALTCPAVRGAVAVLSESVAQLPLILYRRGDDGSKERATDHGLYEILHDQANDFTSAFEFRRDLQSDLLLHGHAFAHIGRSRASGQVVELSRIEPTAVTIDTNDAGEPLYYVTDRAGVRRQIDRADILHLRALNGRSPLHDIREAIGLSLVMEQHQARLFANGARPAGMLRLKGRITPPTLERLQQDFSAKWGGCREAYSMLKEKVVDGLSIGFRTVESQRIKNGRRLLAIDLVEISLVALPALSSARVTSVKHADRRRIFKENMMSLDLSAPDAAPDETASVDLPPEILERIDTLETRAAGVDALAGRLDKLETRLSRPNGPRGSGSARTEGIPRVLPTRP